ncbi:hypothetical protein PVL29_013322 [Vitis rotundifolia]|uniref:O-methyltransferase C-terminal domain-containing protein n=1 Tax=Vitis rotundifolia TaxID=103349 RepID=A0AA38ZL41_VITRO|nr:hypothetical protein PVL29_013322 [Vitis rotundifolia]
MQSVLHDWGDDGCKKVLRNCWKAWPDNGKVIVVEHAIPQVLGNDPPSLNAAVADLYMMILNTDGKERTLAEFEHLAKAAGFAQTKYAMLEAKCHPFHKARGVNVFEYMSKDPRSSRKFNKGMTSSSKIVLDMVLKAYRGGFEEMKEIMNVGGDIGTSVEKLVSVYPHVRRI